MIFFLFVRQGNECVPDCSEGYENKSGECVRKVNHFYFLFLWSGFSSVLI
jgi:hypothetical protein